MSLVAQAGIGRVRNWSNNGPWPGLSVTDPQRRIIAINYRTAKGLFDHLVGDPEASLVFPPHGENRI